MSCVNRTQKVKRTQKPPKFPGVSAPKDDLPEFTFEHQKAFDEMQANCYKHLHKPSVVRIQGWKDTFYYVCKECLEKYIKKHEEMKKLVIRFDR